MKRISLVVNSWSSVQDVTGRLHLLHFLFIENIILLNFITNYFTNQIIRFDFILI